MQHIRPIQLGEDLLGRLTRGAGQTGLIRAAGLVVAFLLQVFLARWLGVEEYGRYAYAWTLAVVLAMLSGLGLPMAAVRLIPTYLGQEDFGRLRGLTRWAPRATLCVAAGTAGVITMVIWLCSDRAPDPGAEIWVGLWLIPLLALVNLNQEIARALHRMVLAFGPSQLGRPVLVLSGAAGLMAWRGKMTGVDAVGLTIAVLCGVVVMQWVGLRWSLPSKHKDHPAQSEARTWLRTSMPMLLSGGSALLLTYTDVLMIGLLRPASDVGVYNAAGRLALPASIFISSLNSSAAPALAELHAKGQVDHMGRVARATAMWSFWPTLAASALMLLAASPLLSFMGPSYLRGWWVLAILLATRVVQSGFGVAGHALNMTGHQTLSAQLMVASVIVNTVLNALLIPAFGINGAAIATAMSIVACYTSFNLMIRRKIGVHTSILAALTK